MDDESHLTFSNTTLSGYDRFYSDDIKKINTEKIEYVSKNDNPANNPTVRPRMTGQQEILLN